MSEKNNEGISSEFLAERKENQVQNESIQSQNVDPVQNESTQSQNVDNQTVDIYKANHPQNGTTQTRVAIILTCMHQALTTAWTQNEKSILLRELLNIICQFLNFEVSTSSLQHPSMTLRYKQL